MADIERETITAKFKGAVDEQRRRVLTFENPRNPDKDIKISVFPPKLPDLVMGKTYEITVEHVPMPDGSGKKYHNLARSEKDGPYIYKEVQAEAKATPPAKYSTAYENAMQHEAKEDYWSARTEREAKRDCVITRQAVLNSAIAYHEAIVISRTNPPAVEDILKTAAIFEEWVKKAEQKKEASK